MRVLAHNQPLPAKFPQNPTPPPPAPQEPKDGTVLGRAVERLPRFAQGAVVGAGSLAPALVGGAVAGVPGALVGGLASLGFRYALDGDLKGGVVAAGWATALGMLAAGGHTSPLGLGLLVGVSAAMGALAMVGKDEGPVRHINKPGESVDLHDKLVPGKTNIVVFSAPWCPACRKVEPQLEQLMKEKPDYVTLKVDIQDGDSPVAKQYGVVTIPCYKIFDDKGALVCEGDEARTRVKSMLGQPG
ncbi:MAG: hypothetical protein KF760_29630 [Candidatus Eremiobacteraeota bacterium]|nr:hypothetical protein [Candidatus Eremiobacteraeota bacterium]MCW5872290.1 hypothetical protein [Candidatus Eremiobacteraeota bacterium]